MKKVANITVLLLLLAFDYFTNNDIGYKCRIPFF